ncbi:MAG TPA: 2-C-methyl-D-erythritol 4-phosphate cytidylyltransferase [Candidatus Limnocylindrales bacterium]|nr:2-C-methyl-D-erythritol 4-phosphate cytidylyltransferase [Candidatus Limnocylindrales bacterium]
MTLDRAAAVADAIVVAAGSSARMSGVDKLAASVGGRPLLAWTLDAVSAAPAVDRVVVVTAPDRVHALRDATWLPSSVASVVAGGDRRQASVAAGLAELDRLDAGGGSGQADHRVVLVHDGARPLVTPALVEAVAEAAAAHGAAIPVVPIAETVKRIEEGRVAATIDRTSLATAQTPQGVRRSILRAAFERFGRDAATFTDEAALLEACSIPVHVIDGDPGNVKVTLPADLARAEAALLARGAMTGTGIGHDSHPFGPGAPLVLGGVRIDGAPRLHGHSDGDVALHAVCDALLGAAGLGDLGRLFPAGPATPEGVASGDLLEEVLGRVAGAGWRPASVDLTIVAARPKLASRLEAIREALAAALGIEPARVNVKASTGNLDGMEGAGRGMSAIAIAVLEAAR